jgi:hypothetical protein
MTEEDSVRDEVIEGISLRGRAAVKVLHRLVLIHGISRTRREQIRDN